jgi:2-oxoglutarate dehydrogenase complex dehydrogenase (E1) component-like enzyme
LNQQSETEENLNESNYKIQENLRLLLLIRIYQYQGHLNANIDPLNLKPTQQSGNAFKEYLERVHLDFRTSGFTELDFDKEFLIYDPKITVIMIINS